MSETRSDLQLGERWAALLRRRYGERHTAKRVALDFAVDARTAQAWLSGQAPHVRHVDRARDLHGPAAIAELFDAWSATLEELVRIEAVEVRIRELRRRVAEAG